MSNLFAPTLRDGRSDNQREPLDVETAKTHEQPVSNAAFRNTSAQSMRDRSQLGTNVDEKSVLTGLEPSLMNLL